MPFFSSSRKKNPGQLANQEESTAQDPPPDKTTMTIKEEDDDKRKDSATINSPTSPSNPSNPSTSTPAKPAPTRNASTRFAPSTPLPLPRNPSNLDRTTSSRTTATAKSATRPTLERRRTMPKTHYMAMLLELDTIPFWCNLLASAFTWILLAGYIVFPATFNKWQKDNKWEEWDEAARNDFERQALNKVRNVSLLYIAAFLCGVGVFGCVGLWWKLRKNYIWVINRIFLPALMNSIAGLVSTIVNIYSAQEGQYSVTAKATIAVTAACSVVTAALFLIYSQIMLAIVKRRHEKEMKAVDKVWNQKDVGNWREKEGHEHAGLGADTGRIV